MYGIPALIDNLAIVYNKDLFQQAGIDPPSAKWTWDDFAAAAKALTDPSKQQYGFAFPIDASEDTVWHYDAMLWEAGGDILNADNTQAAFNSDAGVQALTTLQQMAVTDKSIYLDQQNTGKIDTLFNSGKIAMDVTGPWALSGYPDINYGVQIMPSYPGGSHATIAGPDMWVMFDNNGHGEAAWQFMQWLTAAEQVKADSMESGHLPIRELRRPGARLPRRVRPEVPRGGAVRAEPDERDEGSARDHELRPDQPDHGRGDREGDARTRRPEDRRLDDAANQVNQVLAGG